MASPRRPASRSRRSGKPKPARRPPARKPTKAAPKRAAKHAPKKAATPAKKPVPVAKKPAPVSAKVPELEVRLPGGRRHILSLSFVRDGDEFMARLETDAGHITELKNRSLDQLLTLVASELEDVLE